MLERKPHIGGRAYSYLHPTLEEEIDSQHVLLGCCTNLVDLCQRSQADRYIRWYERITFLEPAAGGHGVRRSEIGPGGLPAPPAATLNFLRAPMLGLRDKLGIVRGVTEFLRGYPSSDEEPFTTWLARTGQTELAVRHFWEPIVLATLNDSFDRCSTRYVGKVMHETLLRNSEGGRFGIPTRPLSTFYGAFVRLAEKQGTRMRLRTSVERLERLPDARWRAHLANGTALETAQILLAIPFEQAAKLLATAPRTPGVDGVCADLKHFSHAPITTIHLWFDRPVTDLHSAALLDTRIQWMFNKTLIRSWSGEGQYLEVTISGSFQELSMSREAILGPALTELARFFPKVREAKLWKSGVLKEARATFSVLPRLDPNRPSNDAPGGGLYLAGDWTRTDWPSTMEGAVRSGRLAAEMIARDAGASQGFMAPDLPATGLVRLLAGRTG